MTSKNRPTSASIRGLVVGSALAILGIIAMDFTAPLYDTCSGNGYCSLQGQTQELTTGNSAIAIVGFIFGLIFIIIGAALLISAISDHKWARRVTALFGLATVWTGAADLSQAYYQSAFGFQTLCYGASGYSNCSDQSALAVYHFDLIIGIVTLIVGFTILGIVVAVRKFNPTIVQQTYQTYIVQEGDTLETIAQKFGIKTGKWEAKNRTCYAIVSSNKLKWSFWRQRYEIHSGQSLKIPLTSQASTTSSLSAGSTQFQTNEVQSSILFCGQCGTKTKTGDKFCEACGAKIA